jgi:hypothetical protein
MWAAFYLFKGGNAMETKRNKEAIERVKARFMLTNPEIECVGQYVDAPGCFGRIVINTSDILSRLIQHAGRYCEHYASDIVSVWNSIERAVNTLEWNKVAHTVIGFRDMGVDTDDDVYVLTAINPYYTERSWPSMLTVTEIPA